MKIDTNITISRPQTNFDYKKIVIGIKDADAGITFLEVELDYDAFTEAITGVGYVPCKSTVRNLNLVGSKREVKTETIPIPDENLDLEKLIAEYEQDGWIGRWSDLKNFHRRVGRVVGQSQEKLGYTLWNVSFHRNIHPKKENS